MAAYSPVKDEEEEVGVCFKDPNWLEAFPLNKDTALDYFSLSQFYDRYAVQDAHKDAFEQCTWFR